MDLLAVQGTLKSLLQHHSSKASILRCSAFFMIQLAHPYMTTGKTIAFTRRTFVGKVMSLLFNMLSRLVITFLPRSKRLLISWLQSPSAVILEPPKIKVCHCFVFAILGRSNKKDGGSSGGSVVKNPLPRQETRVQSLGQEDLLEKEMATHSGILAWEIPQTEEPGRRTAVHEVTKRVRHDLATKQQQIKLEECRQYWGGSSFISR